jgi:hypothetical protein
MGQNKIIKNKRYIAINLILFAILYLSVTFNKEFIRPVYGQSLIIGIITGSFSNFMAAYIISLFPISPIIARSVVIKKARIIIYMTSIIVFLILTIEELKPMWGASTQYDLFDILSSGLGSLFAILTFEIIINWRKRKNKNILT